MADARAVASYLTAEHGLGSWLLTRDHKRVGLLFLGGVLANLALGGLFAMVLRLELLTPEGDLVAPLTYNRLFTMHGVVMIFLFMIPAIPGVFGNFLLPLMIGAKDVAFPRINLLSFYVYLLGMALVWWGMLEGGTDTGWTFYTPYSAASPTRVAPVAVGGFVVGMSSVLSGMNFIVTVHALRAVGMTWHRMQLFVWAIYATALVQVLATPVLGLALLLVGFDHAFDVGLFDASRGGDPVLYQHLFWFYSHPAVYIMVLPAMGVVSEVISGSCRKNAYGYRFIAYSSLGIAFVGFLVWGHHMFVAGQSIFEAGAFSVLSMLTGIFTAIKVFNWVGTIYRGSVVFSTPMAYVFAFFFLLVFGGMTGVAVATVSLDVHWHDTYFVVAHFHFIMVGATLTAFLAALHYWFPKVSGRLYPERWGLASAALVFLGFALTFTPQFLLGNAGMPRRYHGYPPRFQWLHAVSSAGSWILALGLLVVLLVLLWSLRRGARAEANPWGSRGVEWRTPSPPPPENFLETPRFTAGAHLRAAVEG